MADYFRYCPICGFKLGDEIGESVVCCHCYNQVTVLGAKNDTQYYFDKAIKTYADYTYFWQILLDEEISLNPLYNSRIHRQIEMHEYELFGDIDEDEKETSNQPKCPTCQSTNIKRISDFKRATHFVAFGLLSNTARSQYVCNDCGYKW